MIRNAKKENLPECETLLKGVLDEVNSKYYSPEIIFGWKTHNSLKNLEKQFENSKILVYESENRILGLGAIEKDHISKLYVLPEFQKRGIGREILNGLEEIAKENKFNSCNLNSTLNAIQFYINSNYQVLGPITFEERGIFVTFTKMKKELT
jgi:GNAT superfamily N-acetyltransferase